MPGCYTGRTRKRSNDVVRGRVYDHNVRCFGQVRELDPTTVQAAGLLSAVGAVRFAQNALLADVKAALDAGATPSWTFYSLDARWREIRADVAPWHSKNSKECYSYGAERLARGLKSWSDSKSGTRRGAKVGFPSFRSLGHNDSVQFSATRCTAVLQSCGLVVKLPKIGHVRMKEPLTLAEGQRITAVTVRQKAGRWFATFRIREDDWEAPPKSDGDRVVGVDLGIGDRVATLSDGTVVPNKRHYRADEAKLRRVNKAIARKQKGSNNRKKAVRKRARILYTQANRRSDDLHKFTSGLTKNHGADVIVVEDLAVAGMGQALRLGKSVHDAAPAEIRRQLTYKTDWYGVTLVVADRWFPSSRTCSGCGAVNGGLTLSQRTWVCECGAVHDRDMNAAINLKNLAVRSTVAACGDGSSGHHGDETAVSETGRTQKEKAHA